MPEAKINHPDRLFPADPVVRGLARDLYSTVRDLPIINPHGHTDPAWFANNECFTDAVDLLIKPDHYAFRMLYSQGVPLESLGVPTIDGTPVENDSRKIWRTFAAHYHLFAGTPTRIWMDHVFNTVFGLEEALSPGTADNDVDIFIRAASPYENIASLNDLFAASDYYAAGVSNGDRIVVEPIGELPRETRRIVRDEET